MKRGLWIVLCSLVACVDRTLPCPEAMRACGDACADVTSDGAHCGGCGLRCADGERCVSAVCQPVGEQPSCGGRTCAAGQGCHDGACAYDLVAACYDNGQLVGFSAEGIVKGPAAVLGAGPQKLGVWGRLLFVADGLDQKLRTASVETLGEAGGEASVGKSPQGLWIDPPYVYVVSSLSNSLQVLRMGAAPAHALQPAATLSFGANTSPQNVVKVGSDLYVPLFGGLGAGAIAGQRLARVDVSNPADPRWTQSHDLRTLDLKPFEGQAPDARPYEVAHAGGYLFVTLANLAAQPDGTLQPGGPGRVARVDLGSGEVRAFDVGEDVCLNAVSLAPVPDGLVVTCAGKSDYSAWPTVRTEKTGAVLLSLDGVAKSAWALKCPADSSCITPVAGRAVARGSTVFVADQAGGRVFTLEVKDGALVERQGFAAGAPLAVCPVGEKGYSGVSDLAVVP